MKKIGFLILLGVLLFQLGYTQKKRNKNKFKVEATSFNVSEYVFEGIRILQCPNSSDFVVAKIYITGGIHFYEKEEEGIELLALKLAVKGSSKNFSREFLNERLERLGTQIEVYSGYDYSVITMICLREHFAESLQLLMERLLNPKFSLSEFYEIRDQYMAEIVQQEKDPWEQLRNWSLSSYFQGTSFAVNPLGSYQTLFSFTNEGVNLFYQNLLSKKRIYITVVGKIPSDELAVQFHRFLKDLPEENSLAKIISKPVVYTSSNVTFQKKEGTISYVSGIFSAPKPGSLEAFALQIALSILNERLQNKLVYQKGFLQEVFCGYAEFSNPIGNIRFSTTLPSPAVKAVMEEFQKIKMEGVTAQELHQKKQFFLTQYYQKLSNSEQQASIIGNAAFHYSWKEELKSAQKVQSIQNENILNVLQKYMKNIQWYYLGDTKKIGKGAFEKGL